MGKEQMNSGFLYHLRLKLITQVSWLDNFTFEATCVWSAPIPDSDECESGFILVNLSSADAKRLELLLQSQFFENVENLKMQ